MSAPYRREHWIVIPEADDHYPATINAFEVVSVHLDRREGSDPDPEDGMYPADTCIALSSGQVVVTDPGWYPGIRDLVVEITT